MSSPTLLLPPRTRRHATRGQAPRTRVRFAAAAAVGVLCALGGGATTAVAKVVTPPDVPAQIAVGAGHKPFLVGHAIGVQIYPCNGVAWGASTPRAVLTDDDGAFLASHFAGPTWQGKDGGAVVGARVDGVTVNADAIPWLLLSATPAPGSRGGQLTKTTFIQRINTTGGKAPAASACTPEHAGERVEVPYTADYVFWKQA